MRSNLVSTYASSHTRCGRRFFEALVVVLPLLLIGACEGTTTSAERFSRNLAVPVVPVLAPPAQRPVQEGFVDVDGAQLYYWDTGGDGEIIILLHAATGSAESWLYQQPVFADANYRIIAYSRRGHRNSISTANAPPPPHSADLAALTASLRLRRAHLVATAAGAIVAADFAISHPDRVASMVLASSLISFQDPLIVQARERLSLDEVRRLPPDVLELSASYRFAHPDGAALWRTMERHARSDDAASPSPANTVTFEALAAIGVPILLIGGDADLYAPPALLQQIATRLPNAQVVLISGAAHAIYWEQPRAFNAAVLSFLAEHNAGDTH